jgi:predicted TIM-barrel fold metal-dependent hydrolase
MSITLERQGEGPSQPAKSRLRIIDSDIHPALAHPAALHPFLSAHWVEHLTQYGIRPHGVYAGNGTYPRFTPNTARRDAWPPNGQPPGSDLEFLQKQHLDAYDIEIGVLEPLIQANVSRNLEFGAALVAAANDWQVETFTSKEKRLKASILIPAEDAEASVAEIEKRAGDRQFAQIQMGSRSVEPIGRKRYWPIFEAAQRNNLPMGFHIGGPSAHAPSPSGWPSYYAEDHHVLIHSMQAQVASMILEGVFEHFPKLRVVMIEGGFGWAASLAWRLDQHWAKMRNETPHVKMKPSEYMRRNVWFSTQPVEEPENPQDLRWIIEQIGWDRLLYASDYPHWDFDDPVRAFPIQMSEKEKKMLFHDNAVEFYQFKN